MSALVLIIDDEPDIRELLNITLQRMGIDCVCAEDLSSARKLLKDNKFNLCLTDMRLSDGDGVDFVSEIQSHDPCLPVAVITAHGSMDSAIQALKNGAFDFLTKPVDLHALRNIVEDAIKTVKSNTLIKSKLIGDSQSVHKLKTMIEKVARSQAPIYISGESGSGKELVARLIHENGPRSDQPIIAINCGAIPHELMESEFFGHKKGSFTGAISDKEGLFQAANGGTLFLDEVAELSLSMQVKLLRAIQEKVIRPVGAQKEIPVNVRILSATNFDLTERVKQGLFRQDLLFRINVINIHIPPLRERQDDIPLLVEHILDKLVASNGFTSRPVLSQSALDALIEYTYPGNIRELENILERAIALCTDNLITEQDIGIVDKCALNNINDADDLNTLLGDIEKQKIIETLEKTRWNKTAAAKILGISFRALRYRLEKLNIE